MGRLAQGMPEILRYADEKELQRDGYVLEPNRRFFYRRRETRHFVS